MTPDPQPEHPQPWRMSKQGRARLRLRREQRFDAESEGGVIAHREWPWTFVEDAVALGIVKPCEAEPGIPARAEQKAAFDVWADNGPHSHSLREIIVLPTPESDGEFNMTRHEAFAAFRAGVRFARTGSPFKGPAEPGEPEATEATTYASFDEFAEALADVDVGKTTITFATTPSQNMAEPGERVHARPSEPVTYSLALLNAEAKWLRENADAYERCANEPASDLRQKLIDVERAASALREQREAGTRTEGESDAEQRA